MMQRRESPSAHDKLEGKGKQPASTTSAAQAAAGTSLVYLGGEGAGRPSRACSARATLSRRPPCTLPLSPGMTSALLNSAFLISK